MGAAAPNPRTCRILTPSGLLKAPREAPPGVWRTAHALLTCPAKQGQQHLILRARVSATGFSVSGKGQFPAREKSENGVPNRMPFPQRRTLMSRADVDRPAKNARIITQNNKTPSDLEGCPTRGAGRT